jgi:hypothetical protein
MAGHSAAAETVPDNFILFHDGAAQWYYRKSQLA